MNLFGRLLKLTVIFHFNWMLIFQFGERSNLQSFHFCFWVGLIIFVTDMFMNMTSTCYSLKMNITKRETKRSKNARRVIRRQEQAR